MITITAHGFLAQKPELALVSASNSKCEFTVLWPRQARRNNSWDTVWERAVFVAWNDDAEKIASRLDKGTTVTCTGLQETSQWEDKTGQKRFTTKYRLTSWIVQPKSGDGNGGHGQSADRQSRAPVHGDRIGRTDALATSNRVQRDHDVPREGYQQPPASEDDFLQM